MTCRDCIHDRCCDMWAVESGLPFVNPNTCEHFKNKADFIEVVRCEKCKYGDVSTISKAKDGEEDIACYCTLKKVVTNTDSYCPSGRKR